MSSPVAWISFDAGPFETEGAVTIDYYNVSGSIFRTERNPVGWTHFEAQGPLVYVRMTGVDPGGFGVDNVSFNPAKLALAQPFVDIDYQLDASSTSATIPFSSRGSSTSRVDWSVDISYQTSGGKGTYLVGDTFSTPANAETTRTYRAVGGRVTVHATSKTGGGNCILEYVYLVGVAIPDQTITSYLTGLYSGTTTGLLTGIAQVESAYRQFTARVLYDHSGLWPLESYDGGSHIGLMQMAVERTVAWDWLTNASSAATLFGDKISSAKRIERSIRQQYVGLPALSAIQIENMALVLYGPYASGDLTKQYYIPQTVNGISHWVINLANAPDGVAYADSCRQGIHY